MQHSLNVIQAVFQSIRMLFSGNIPKTESYELRKIEEEIYDITYIPHTKEDRINLKGDRDAVISDYNEALDKKILELHQ